MSPVGRRPTFLIEREIDFHHHRRDHYPDKNCNRHIDLTALAEFQPAQCSREARQDLADKGPATMQSAIHKER
jgi:hypothetical protein